MSETKPTALFVYICECTMKGGKAGLEFLRVSQEQYDRGEEPKIPTCIFSKKGFKGLGQPGTVYEFQIEEKEAGLSIYPSTRRYVGHWPDNDKRLEWQAKNRAFVNDRDARALEKKEATQSLFDEQLGPLRDKYHKIPHPQKQAFLAAVIYYITK